MAEKIACLHGVSNMKNSNAVQNDNEARARVIGRVELQAAATGRKTARSPADDQDFMQALATSPWMSRQAEREYQRVLSEIVELQSENRWDDINALFHPVEDKLADLCAAGMDADIRQKVAFSLCRSRRHQDAIRCIKPVASREPDNVMAHYTLAYTALDLLYTARTKRQLLTPQRRREIIDLAHRHFAKTQELRPESVTFFYREGILYKEIEDKPRKAVPLFKKAIMNWDRLSDEEKKQRHQQRPKFIRALYHLASSLLKIGMPARSLEVLERVMDEDRDRDHVSAVFKHFAMGKVLNTLGRPEEALDHLDTAAFRAGKDENIEYVYELCARCCLVTGNSDRALTYIEKIAPNRRRPYVRWTHSDVLVAAGRIDEALKLLESCAEHDRRTRHVALIRIARIHYADRRMERALNAASDAANFCEHTFGNASNEALFWQAASLHGLGRNVEALEVLEDLAARRFQYPGMGRLLSAVRQATRQERHDANRMTITLVT